MDAIFFFVFYAFSAHVQASISTRRVNGGHAYYTVKTNEKSTFSGFYVFYIFVGGTDFFRFFLYFFVVKSLTFWRARFISFGSIFGVILDGFGFNLASKTLQEAFQEAFQKNIKFWYSIFSDFWWFWGPPGALEIVKKCYYAAGWWSHFGSKSGLGRKWGSRMIFYSILASKIGILAKILQYFLYFSGL